MEKIELAKIEPTAIQSVSPAEMMVQAVKGGIDPSQLEALLNLQMKYEANEAKKAYHVAMSNFKANAPDIVKDKQVAFKEVKYKHASLFNVTKSISAVLSQHGLSASWSSKQNGGVTVTCKITHVLGHSEETSLTAQPDASGSKNSIQQIGSTITYLERYTLLMLTGLATSDQDDDGQKSSTVDVLSEEQISKIKDYTDNAEGFDMEGFLKYMKIGSIEEMPKNKFNLAMKTFEIREAQKNKKGYKVSENVVDVDGEGK